MAGQPVGTHDARSPHTPWHAPQRYAAAPGLEVSPRDVLENPLVQTRFGRQTLELAVLLPQFLQAFGLVHLQTAVLLAPPVAGLLGDPGLAACYRVCLALPTATSICRRMFTICSGVCFLALPISGSFHTSLSHLRWYRICPAGQYRNLSREITTAYSCEILQQLQHHQVDLALITSPPPSASITSVRVATEPFIIMVRPKHPLAAKSAVRLSEVAKYPWIFSLVTYILRSTT